MIFELRTSKGKVYKIQGEFRTLGRSKENDIVVEDNAISRHHLNFFIKNNFLIVEDAGSQNGFLINGEKVEQPTQLKTGDKITFGHETYLVVPEGFSGPMSFDIPKIKKTADATKGIHTQSFEIKGVPQLQNKRIFLWGAVGLFLAFLYYSSNVSAPIKGNRNKLEEALAPLPSEGYLEEDPTPKTQNELMADSRLKEAIRDYYNDNYSRAIIGFQTALTLDPSNEEARSFLERSSAQLKYQIENMVFHADKAFRLRHFKRAKGLAVAALNILTERTPGYIRKIAQQNAGLEDNRIPINQEMNLMELPCEQAQHVEICKKAMEIMKRSRVLLGEENTLK